MLNPLHASDLKQIVQSIKTNLVAGAAANTNIPIAGIAVEDTILSVIEFPGPGEAAGQVPVDRTAQTTITSAGNIQVSVATNTSADRRLVVRWFDKSSVSVAA